MTQAKSGDTVRIHYTGTLSDGTTFDSSREREPLEFTLGASQIIPGLEREIDGMSVGETRTVTVPAAEAYGSRDPSRQQVIERSMVPAHIPLDLGTQLQLQTPEGQAVMVVVAAVTEQEVTLDANHPLAGEDLTFEVEMVEIA